VDVRTADRDDCLVVTAEGFMTPADSGSYCQAVLKALAESPRVVACDLSRVPDMSGRASTAFLLLAQQASAWPETTVVVVGATGELRRRLVSTRVRDLFASARTLDDALAIPPPRPDVVQARLRLPPTVEAPRLARKFVRRHVPDTAGPALAEAVESATSELAANVVRHTGSDLEVRVTMSDDLFRVAVKDTGAGWPGVVRDPADDERGRGLALVELLSERWGVLPTRDGGKSVWCQFRLPR
jgi:anti-sigma regulatory factor (Ser/Thr protein kinase)